MVDWDTFHQLHLFYSLNLRNDKTVPDESYEEDREPEIEGRGEKEKGNRLI